VPPDGTSICDYYTKALLGDTSAEHEATLLTLLVNTVVIGNYTKPTIPNVKFPDVMVPGILAKGMVNDTEVNLLPYFNGGLASSNRGGDSGVSVNFLDDGGAAPLMMNMPSNGTSSNQYFLLTHLYQFFGTLLGCTSQGTSDAFSAYKGHPSMYNVHKFMALSYAENTYFIQQVGLAAQSFGVADSDIQKVAMSLSKAFNYRCAPAITLAPALGSQLQSICTAEDCPVAANSTCSAYAPVMQPGIANGTLAMGEGNKTSTATMTAANGGMPTGGSMGGAAGGSASAGGNGPATTSPATAGAAAIAGSGLAAGLAAVAMIL